MSVRRRYLVTTGPVWPTAARSAAVEVLAPDWQAAAHASGLSGRLRILTPPGQAREPGATGKGRPVYRAHLVRVRMEWFT